MSPGVSHLAVLQRMDFRVEGGTDDLIIMRVGRRACSGDDVEACDALCVCYSVILPRHECFTVQRTFQNPVSRPRRVCSLQDHISDLEDLCERRTWKRILINILANI